MNVGCIPTKAILHAAEALTEAKEMAEYGIHIEVKNVDWKQVQAKKNAITAQLVGGVTGLMKANKIQVVEGTGILRIQGYSGCPEKGRYKGKHDI